MEGAKKYWWAAAVVVPIVVALIAIIPKLMSGGGGGGGGGGSQETFYVDVVGTQYNGKVAFNNVTIVAEQANQQLGTGLSPELAVKLQQALDLSQAKNFKAAIPVFESLAKTAPVPAVYNNLGAAYLATGNKEMARRSFESALALEPKSQTARFNLGQADAVEPSTDPVPVKNFSGVEQEPNETILQAAPIRVGQVLEAQISSKADHDFVKFSFDGPVRDKVAIRFENQSTSLRPHVKVFNQNKSHILNQYDNTFGANLSFDLAVEPGATYYLQVLPYDSSGQYRLRLVAQKAYDQYEPNDDPFSATPMKLGQALDANIMDGKDTDWYKLSGVNAAETTVRYSNRSMSLRPHVRVYDNNKSELASHYNGTFGADLEFVFKSKPGNNYYLKVLPYDSSGDYQLQAR